YWLLWSMRRVMPKRSTWRVMQFDTLRLRLVKIAARVVELKTQLKIHLPSSAPDQAIFATLLGRLPRLVTSETGLMPPNSPVPRPPPAPTRLPPKKPTAGGDRHAYILRLQPIRVRLHPHLRCVVCSCIARARSAASHPIGEPG